MLFKEVPTSLRKLQVRGLKHGEVKALKLRQTLSQPDLLTDEVLEETVKAGLLTQVCLDDLYYWEVQELFRVVVEQTFLTEDTRKNLNLPPSSGPQEA